ncbi:hypothetical protein Ahy_B08g089221 [Arachis hypogaea]|uniref:Uncharacterized protein n=1 Tax=Arachis hypogaea TaxID=3818 RepID=A0A444XXM9_ARAHY|nr:hypothetical protein Ahy_B08g089221 [Arachis hypogaea]
MVQKEPSIAVEIETTLTYRENETVENIRIMIRVFWNFYPYIRALRSYKSIVQVDDIHLF